MNSAIQCLSNTLPLANYFLEGKFKEEINAKNPLGMGGKVAEAFAALISALWSGTYVSYSPYEFKKTIGTFAPQFRGDHQHDAQELLAFLLDGLHEDLNRIKDKPYVEVKESNGRSDGMLKAQFF